MTDKIYEYKGEAVSVTYDKHRCIHAAECVRGLPSVFDPKARPWIQPDGATADEVAEVVTRCPTGALRFVRHDGADGEAAADENVLTVAADGPVYARGRIVLQGAEGAVEENRVGLCRCGASKNKPFCDGSHSEAGFQATAAIGEDPKVRSGEASANTLEVKPLPDGPLLLDGPFEIRGGDDQCSGTNAALCRCGASESKPFCDGAHKAIGFKSA